MSGVKDLHRQAMRAADLGHAARRGGDAEVARRHFEEAFQIERSAAELLLPRFDAEPSRSILLRSAATLALEAGRLSEAEQMVCAALAGQPRVDLAEELRDLFEQINFRRHLTVRGVTLTERELQLSVAGRGVGFGIAPTDAVIERIKHTQALLYRFTERRLEKPYREKGAPSREIREAVSLFMAVPRAASYAVSLVVGGLQEALPGISVGEAVIDDVIECLDLFAREDEEALHDRIPGNEYLTNFKALAKAMAPDGEEIETVGFTAVREGREKTVALRPVRRPQVGVPNVSGGSERTRAPTVSVTGTLLFADAMEHKQSLIKILDKEGKKHSIVVPAGMMGDIVRPLWDSCVTVSGTWSGRRITLSDIVKERDSR